MDINFEYYKIFYFVGKYGNITKAAAASTKAYRGSLLFRRAHRLPARAERSLWYIETPSYQ